MTPLLIEKEVTTGFSTGEADISLWIKTWGLDEAIEKADYRLSTLMIENGISDLKLSNLVLVSLGAPPYIIGLMKAYQEFLSRHCLDQTPDGVIPPVF